MNKQQLAQKIWASANQMRSKIEANEYKDYILGFIFYKYLSDKEVKFLKENDYDNELLLLGRLSDGGKHCSPEMPEPCAGPGGMDDTGRRYGIQYPKLWRGCGFTG